MKDGDYLFKRILSGLLVSAMLTGSVVYLTGCSNSQNGSDDNTSTNTSTEYAHADKIDNGTILQCFSWDFNTIKESMADIAASGYTALQTSPINACLEGENGGMQLYGDGNGTIIISPPILKSVTISSELVTSLKLCVTRRKSTVLRLLLMLLLTTQHRPQAQ